MVSGAGLKGLKVLVITLGVLLVAGFIVLLVALGQRIASLSGSGDAATALYDLDLQLAPTERVASMTGVGDRLALLIEGPDGSTRVLVVDPAVGRVVGAIGRSAP